MEQMAEEHCYMVAPNSSCRIIGMFLLSKGTVNATLITPKGVYIRALPVTKQLKEAGELININFADHIIIGGDGFLSLKQERMLDYSGLISGEVEQL